MDQMTDATNAVPRLRWMAYVSSAKAADRTNSFHANSANDAVQVSSYSHQTDKTSCHFDWLTKNNNRAVDYRLANHIGRIAGYVTCLLLFINCLLTSAYAAEGTRPAFTPPSPAVSSGSVVQIIFSLLLVLAAIVLVAWLLKRMNVAQQGSGHLLKVLGGVSIGQRERIVLVEINDTWLVVGVGPGQIRTLHTLQKAENSIPDTQSAEIQPSENKFANLLSSVLSHGKHGSESK